MYLKVVIEICYTRSFRAWLFYQGLGKSDEQGKVGTFYVTWKVS